MNILFVGGGKMATALVRGLLHNNTFPHDVIWACDIKEESRVAFTEATGLPCAPDASKLAGKADVIVLAVKPQVAEMAVKALPPRKEDVLIISICAGISITKLRHWFNSCRIVRVMPNTPLMVGQGASCYALSTLSDENAAGFVSKMLSALGEAWRVPEKQLDAVTAISGSGPAYMFAFVEALQHAGEKLGLPAELAEQLAIQTMGGSVEMMRRKLGTPAELRVAVTSPGGTTAAALDVMKEAGFYDMVDRLAEAAAKRSAELGA